MLTEQDIQTICQAWHEFNAIRARDGRANGMSEESWDLLTDRLGAIIEKLTGNQAHCNPLLYKRREDLSDDK